METRKLGQDLSVSALGYGCMGLSHAYGEALDEKEAVRVLRAKPLRRGTPFLTRRRCMVRKTTPM